MHSWRDEVVGMLRFADELKPGDYIPGFGYVEWVEVLGEGDDAKVEVDLKDGVTKHLVAKTPLVGVVLGVPQ